MAKTSTINLAKVVRTCRERAAEFKESAKRYSSSHNKDLGTQYEGMALAAERLADEFEALAAPIIHPEHLIEERARTIDPTTFAHYDAMVLRLRGQGADEAQIRRAAKLTYGADIDTARSKASAALDAEAKAKDSDEIAYARGFEDAILWHEARARQAEVLEGTEMDAGRKAKLRVRIERHRLYAKQLREELDRARQAEKERTERAAAIDQGQQRLPLDALPIEIQAAFLKRTDNVAGEAFD